MTSLEQRVRNSPRSATQAALNELSARSRKVYRGGKGGNKTGWSPVNDPKPKQGDGGWMDNIGVKAVLGVLKAVDVPASIIRSGLREGMDAAGQVTGASDIVEKRYRTDAERLMEGASPTRKKEIQKKLDAMLEELNPGWGDFTRQVGEGEGFGSLMDDYMRKGVESNKFTAPWWARTALGVVGDVALDPLTYATGGAVVAMKSGGKAAAKKVLSEGVERAGAAALKKEGMSQADDIARDFARRKMGRGVAKDVKYTPEDAAKADPILESLFGEASVAAKQIVEKGGGRSALSAEQMEKFFGKKGGLAFRMPGTGRYGRGIIRSATGKTVAERTAVIVPKTVTDPAMVAARKIRGAFQELGDKTFGRIGTNVEGRAILRSGNPEQVVNELIRDSVTNTAKARASVGFRLIPKDGKGSGELASDVYLRGVRKTIKRRHREVIEAVENGTVTAEEGAAELQKLFDDMRESAVEQGLDIDKRGNYIPRTESDAGREARVKYQEKNPDDPHRPQGQAEFEYKREDEAILQAFGLKIGDANAAEIRAMGEQLAEIRYGKIKGGYYEGDLDKLIPKYQRELGRRVEEIEIERALREAGILQTIPDAAPSGAAPGPAPGPPPRPARPMPGPAPGPQPGAARPMPGPAADPMYTGPPRPRPEYGPPEPVYETSDAAARMGWKTGGPTYTPGAVLPTAGPVPPVEGLAPQRFPFVGKLGSESKPIFDPAPVVDEPLDYDIDLEQGGHPATRRALHQEIENLRAAKKRWGVRTPAPAPAPAAVPPPVLSAHQRVRIEEDLARMMVGDTGGRSGEQLATTQAELLDLLRRDTERQVLLDARKTKVQEVVEGVTIDTRLAAAEKRLRDFESAVEKSFLTTHSRAGDEVVDVPAAEAGVASTSEKLAQAQEELAAAQKARDVGATKHPLGVTDEAERVRLNGVLADAGLSDVDIPEVVDTADLDAWVERRIDFSRLVDKEGNPAAMGDVALTGPNAWMRSSLQMISDGKVDLANPANAEILTKHSLRVTVREELPEKVAATLVDAKGVGILEPGVAERAVYETEVQYKTSKKRTYTKPNGQKVTVMVPDLDGEVEYVQVLRRPAQAATEAPGWHGVRGSKTDLSNPDNLKILGVSDKDVAALVRRDGTNKVNLEDETNLKVLEKYDLADASKDYQFTLDSGQREGGSIKTRKKQAEEAELMSAGLSAEIDNQFDETAEAAQIARLDRAVDNGTLYISEDGHYRFAPSQHRMKRGATTLEELDAAPRDLKDPDTDEVMLAGGKSTVARATDLLGAGWVAEHMPRRAHTVEDFEKKAVKFWVETTEEERVVIRKRNKRYRLKDPVARRHAYNWEDVLPRGTVRDSDTFVSEGANSHLQAIYRWAGYEKVSKAVKRETLESTEEYIARLRKYVGDRKQDGKSFPEPRKVRVKGGDRPETDAEYLVRSEEKLAQVNAQNKKRQGDGYHEIHVGESDVEYAARLDEYIESMGQVNSSIELEPGFVSPESERYIGDADNGGTGGGEHGIPPYRDREIPRSDLVVWDYDKGPPLPPTVVFDRKRPWAQALDEDSAPTRWEMSDEQVDQAEALKARLDSEAMLGTGEPLAPDEQALVDQLENDGGFSVPDYLGRGMDTKGVLAYHEFWRRTKELHEEYAVKRDVLPEDELAEMQVTGQLEVGAEIHPIDATGAGREGLGEDYAARSAGGGAGDLSAEEQRRAKVLQRLRTLHPLRAWSAGEEELLYRYEQPRVDLGSHNPLMGDFADRVRVEQIDDPIEQRLRAPFEEQIRREAETEVYEPRDLESQMAMVNRYETPDAIAGREAELAEEAAERVAYTARQREQEAAHWAERTGGEVFYGPGGQQPPLTDDDVNIIADNWGLAGLDADEAANGVLGRPTARYNRAAALNSADLAEAEENVRIAMAASKAAEVTLEEAQAAVFKAKKVRVFQAVPEEAREVLEVLGQMELTADPANFAASVERGTTPLPREVVQYPGSGQLPPTQLPGTWTEAPPAPPRITVRPGDRGSMPVHPGTNEDRLRPIVLAADLQIRNEQATTIADGLYNSSKVEGAAVKRLRTPIGHNILSNSLRDGMEVLQRNPSLAGPREVVDIMNKVNKVIKDPNKFLKTYDMFLHNLVSWQLASPGFHVRNYLGGFFNNYLADVDAFAHGRFLKDWRKFENGTLKDSNKIRIMTELMPHLQGGQFTGEAIGGTLKTMDSAVSRSVGRNNPWLRLNRGVGSNVETVLRGALGYDRMLKGGHLDEALADITKFHFDYQDLSNFEQGVIKRIVPFYTWTRRNLPLQVEMALQSPGKFANMERGRRTLEERGVQEDIVPAFYKDLFAIPIGIGAGTKQGQVYVTPDLPFGKTVAGVFPDLKGGGPVGIAAPLLSQVTPLIKAPIELARGAQVFKGTPFRGEPYRKMGGGSDAKYEPNPAYMDIPGLTGLMKGLGLTDGKGRITDKGQYLTEQLFPLAGRVRKLRPRAERDKLRSWSSMASFAGLPLRENTKYERNIEVFRRMQANK